MPKYKLRNVYKTLLQIWLFYYFLNTLKVYKCQQLEDVEFISATKNVENDVSDVNRGISDSEFIYEPVETIKNDYNNFDDEIEDRNKVNLNVNNNLHDGEALSEAGEAPSRFTEINEQEISGEKILYASESPFLLRQDLEVQRNAKLIVEPGVTVHFAPMVGITVHGQIKAIGEPSREITFTSQPNSGYPEHAPKTPEEMGARLVDGPSPLEGRLQIMLHGKWRSVCSNSRNWTISDYETVCRQMGFQGGRFWNWMEKLQNFDPRLLYEEPECRGTEHSVFECHWQRHQLGSGVCDYHNDLGVQCLPLLESASSHWRGLKFVNAESTRALSAENTVYDSVSYSELKHVNIIRAGAGRNRMVTAAIESIGVPPTLDHVTIDYAAFTGINVTRSQSSFNFHEVTVRRSRGFGIFVNSSHGAAMMDRCNVNENGADGIRYVGHDLRFDERSDRSDLREFCTLAITAGQTYPIELQVEQTTYSASTKECEQKFSTRPGYVLTVHFVNFVVTKNDTAEILVTDGSTSNDRVLMEWSVRNYTRVQSVMSTREYIFVRFKAQPRSPVLAYLRVTSGLTKGFDLNVTNSVISDNGGRGIAVDNLRSQVHIHKSSISNNNHIAGLHVTSGAGDVNVTESKISFNHGAGINITYYGGNRNISRSSLSSNEGYGFAVWLNQTTKDRAEFLAVNQTTVIQYSRIIRNLEVGVLHGNFCGDFWVNITGNLFNESISNGIDIQTCWFDQQEDRKLRLQIGHNEFQRSEKIGIIISPALNIDGVIEHNHFYFGKYGGILIRNDQFVEFYDLFRTLPAKFNIQQNFFMRNQGVYVASLGLNSYTDREIHSILFSKNFVQNNKIQEPFGQIDGENQPTGGEGMNGEGRLNPRSRVAAPIVISSSNVDVYRNIIYNRDSKYEIGSQVTDQSQILNCTYNWLGSKDEEKVFERLFHRKDRFDLAKIEYLPYLLHWSNPGTTLINPIPTYIPRFHVEGSDKVGGEVDGQEFLASGSYEVERDINIRPGGKLTLQSGVILNFAPSVGMMVAGKLEARGTAPDDILFTLKREPVMVNETSEMVMIDGEVEADTEPVIPKNLPPSAPVRLLGGRTEHEGRLQVMVDGKWGTVCDYGWNIIDAALVCHQLGLALNPIDWRLERSEIPGAGSQEDILLSHVRCTEHDTDITKCRVEKKDEFENSCTHDMDVGVRCYEGAWAGVRFGVLADRADIQYVTVKKAGLFDYTTNIFKPAVQIDFARHNFDHLRVVENLHDGLGVIYSDIFGGGAVNNVRNSEFSNNLGNGISLKQLGLQVHGSIIKNNLGSGVSHDPVIGAYEQRELAGWFKLAPDFIATDFIYPLTEIPGNDKSIEVDQLQMKYFLTKEAIGEEIEQIIKIKCQPGYVIGIQLLNPIENRSSEEIYIYDSITGNPKSDMFLVKRDLSSFPLTTTSYAIVFKYVSGPNALGGAVLTLSSIPAPAQTIYNRIIKGPVPTLLMTSTKVQGNSRGLTATYYNRYLGEKGEHYLRKANESMLMRNCEINYNKEEAVFIHAPFWDVHVSNISEVTLHINQSSIADNGRGIRQFSKDLRSSNNLFHYVLQDTAIERNAAGGMEVNLPYVWQYNINFTHSVFFGNNTWSKNEKFGIVIDGHYAEVNITGNKFLDNHCQNGLMAFRGMEKKLKIEENKILSNVGRFMVEFNSDSQSEILGEVFAVFRYNELKDNTAEGRTIKPGGRSFFRGTRNNPIDPTCVIGFGGVQHVQIFRNLVSGNMQDYDLVAGVKSARLGNFLDAQENWWGSRDPQYIDKRIFDFDDWNNHAEARWRPYLIEDNVLGSISVSFVESITVDLDNLGGRIYEDLTLTRRATPYVIKRDITVMPDVTLNIGGGVEMEFAPNVGILVLGTLNARGGRESTIKMRPIAKQSEELNRIERSIENMVNQDSTRLCTNRNCTIEGPENQEVREGFLEYFNHTTLQWIPICDRRFTERNAQVVCRELGFDPLNMYFGHDRRIEYHTNSLTRIWTWVEPFECHGDETRLEECPERLNGQLYGRRHQCKWDDEFVFVSCHGDIDPKPYWGGIRFANPDFEDRTFEDRMHDSRTHETKKKLESFVEYVILERAGLLHGEKSPAIQSISQTPTITSVTIKDCAYHGVNLVSPRDAMHLKLISIENTMGQGINAISLTGESQESEESSFTPLRNLDLPYNLFSMIDICDVSKVITIEERVLVYYKYDNNPVNCVKIFKSAFAVKPLGFRLLQSNLFNHSIEYGRPDSIHLFDGDIYNYTAKHIGSILAQSGNERRLFKTFEPMLSVRLIASGAPARHGFIAEVVTLPISAIGFNRDAQHNISNCEISGTIGSALTYVSAGEVSPILTLERNRMIRNGMQLYGNFSTSEAAVRIDVQNMQSFFFRNNLVQENQGGLSLRSDSRGAASAMRAFINNNLFVKNTNRPALSAEGRSASPYQAVTIYKNYFTQNMAGFDDVIVLRQVVSNFSYNYVHSNTGGRIIEISGFDKVRLPIYQTTAHNGFYSNVATDWRGRTTIVAGTAGQSYVDNIFFNPENDYEISTVNRSIFDAQFWNSTRDIYKTKIDATHNFWNWNETLAVSSRIRDLSDDPTLLEVQYLPLHMNNRTILDGEKCPPGWTLVFDTCYMYVGAPMTFHEARDFCRSDNASLPFIRDDTTQLWAYLQQQMQHLRYAEHVWIQDYDYLERCTAFVYRTVEFDDCNMRNAFLCEIDPKIIINPLSWQADIIAISVISFFIVGFILMCCIGYLWWAKSKTRHSQRLQRRNSIRQSLRSLNMIGGDPQGSIRRRNYMNGRSSESLSKSTGTDYKKMLTNGSIESMDKSVLSSEASFGAYEVNPNPQPRFNEYSVQPAKRYSPPDTPQKAKIYGLPPTPPVPLEGLNSFELSFRNDGFRDNSTIYTNTTRNNSVSTNINEDTPIIHQVDNEEYGSDFYGNASTLPMRVKGDNLSFLNELKNRLPEYEAPRSSSGHSSFIPANQDPNSNISQSSTLPYDKKIDNFTFSPPKPAERSEPAKTRRPDAFVTTAPEVRRPDSYMKAVRKTPRDSVIPKSEYGRPKTLYEGSQEPQRPSIPPPAQPYSRSKSEALLETNFDDEEPPMNQLSSDSRSHSQPLETEF